MAMTKAEFEALTPEDLFYIERPYVFYELREPSVINDGDRAIYRIDIGRPLEGWATKVTEQFLYVEHWILHQRVKVRIPLSAIFLKSKMSKP